MQDLFIIEYVSTSRFRIYRKKNVLECWSPEQIKEKLAENKDSLMIFVVPFYIGGLRTKELLGKVFPMPEVQGFIASRPSVLCLYTFSRENMLYVNINIADKDDVCTTDCGSIIQDAGHIEAEEIKKSVMSDNHKIECYIEVVQDGILDYSLCRRFEGYLDSVVDEVYNMLRGEVGEKTLANSICVDSRSVQLKNAFKTRFAMAMCTNVEDSIRKTTFLEVPDFVKDISFVWESAESFPACVGALKAMNTIEKFRDLFIPLKSLHKIDGEDIYLNTIPRKDKDSECLS